MKLVHSQVNGRFSDEPTSRLVCEAAMNDLNVEVNRQLVLVRHPCSVTRESPSGIPVEACHLLAIFAYVANARLNT